MPLLDPLLWQNYLCCLFVAKKSAEIHATTSSRKNSLKECTKVFSNIIFFSNFFFFKQNFCQIKSLKIIQTDSNQNGGCRKLEILLQRGYRWNIWLVQIKIHSILIRPATLSRRGPSRSWETAGTYFFDFFRNLLSKFTNVKSKLKFCPKHPSLGTDICNLEVPKPLKSAKFWTGMIQILILATQFGFEKNRNYRPIFHLCLHCAALQALALAV